MAEIDTKYKLKRFCYIGRIDPVYVRLRAGIKVEQAFPVVKALVSKLDDQAFINSMTDVLRHGISLPRKDEVIFAFATYLASDVECKFKANVRRSFPTMFPSDEELFLFCKYSRYIQALSKRKGFSRTTKKAIVSWYEMRTPEELREMWFKHRGMYGFSHKNLIRMCHITDETVGEKEVCDAFFKKCSELAQQTTVKKDVVTEADMRKHIAMQNMCALRTTAKRNEATKIVKNLKLTWDQVPPGLLKLPSVMELLLPQMSFLEIVKKWHIIQQFGHFEKPRVLKLLCSLTNKESQERANVHPTVFLWRMDRLGIPASIEGLEKVAEKKRNAMRMPHFQEMFFNSFNLNRSAGLRTFVAITLQENYKKKFLTKKCKKITYYQAAVALAFSYFKREKHSDVFTYTAENVKLMPIPWEKEMEYSDAIAMCDKYKIMRSSQRLIQPLMEGLCRKQVYDLFIVIVPTAGRSNPKQNSDFLCKFLDKYRETRNKRAKFVIVSLLKKKKSMNYSSERNENILEVCGLDGDTTILIDSFALNRFG